MKRANTTELQLTLLAEISAKLSRLCEAVEVTRPARAMRYRDVEAMRRILPVVGTHFHGGEFSAWEVLDCAAQRDVLGASLRLVLGKRSAQGLGQLLARARDQDIGGFTLRRAKSDANGARWRAVANGAS